MMRMVNAHPASTPLSRLSSEVAAGEVVVITQAGQPVAAGVSLIISDPWLAVVRADRCAGLAVGAGAA